MSSRVNFWVTVISLFIIVAGLTTVGYLYFLQPEVKTSTQTAAEAVDSKFPIAPERERPLPSIKDLVNKILPDIFVSDNNQSAADTGTFFRLPLEMVAGVGLSKIKGQTTILVVDKRGVIFRILGGDVERLGVVATGRISNVVFGGNTNPRIFLTSLNEEGKSEAFLVSINLASSTSEGQTYDVTTKAITTAATEIVSQPNGNGFLSLENTAAGSQARVLDNSWQKVKDLFTSEYRQWKIGWPENKELVFTSRPAASVPGYSYSIDSITGEMKKIIGPVAGLEVTRSPKTKTVVYSSVGLGQINPLRIRKSGAGDLELSIRTIINKCAWSEDGIDLFCGVPKGLAPAGFLDSWYRGETSTEDALWSINTNTGTANLVLDPEKFKAKIDASKIVAFDSYIYILDKKTLSLWAFKATSN